MADIKKIKHEIITPYNIKILFKLVNNSNYTQGKRLTLLFDSPTHLST